MTEGLFDTLDLPRAAVHAGATLEAAARELYRHGAGAIAVLEGERVTGMLTEDDLLRALFPPYLDELTHTAFVEHDDRLLPHLEVTASTAISGFVRAPEMVAVPTSALDIAQRFLHTDSTALIAVRDARFAGVITQAEFCRTILRRYAWRL